MLGLGLGSRYRLKLITSDRFNESMSHYGPCSICGTYTSVGPFEDLICNRCSEDDEPYRPEQTLHKLLREQEREEIEGTKVKHRHYGTGDVIIALDEATVQFERKELNIASDCLELVSDLSELQE